MLEGCDRNHEDRPRGSSKPSGMRSRMALLGPIVEVFVLGTENRPDAADRKCERPAMALTGRSMPSLDVHISDLQCRVCYAGMK